MKLLARILGLSLIITTIAALPASAARPCGCDFCQQVSPNTPCELEGRTTCGAFLIVALCPAQARAEQPVAVSAQPEDVGQVALSPAGAPESLVCQLGEEAGK